MGKVGHNINAHLSAKRTAVSSALRALRKIASRSPGRPAAELAAIRSLNEASLSTLELSCELASEMDAWRCSAVGAGAGGANSAEPGSVVDWPNW